MSYNMCLHVMSHLSPCHVTCVCHITCVSMSCCMCLHVMSHLSPCHVTCVSVSYNMCLHVMSHVSMSYFSVSCHMCLYVMLHVSPCHVTCLSMQCCMSLHVMSHASPYCVICISMLCHMCLYVIYVYPCHVTWERYSIQILVNAMNNSFLPYQNITKTNIWCITDFFFNITNEEWTLLSYISRHFWNLYFFLKNKFFN